MYGKIHYNTVKKLGSNEYQWMKKKKNQKRKSTRMVLSTFPFYRGGNWGTEALLNILVFHALDKEMATNSNVLVWRIIGTGEPGGLPSVYEVAQSQTRLGQLRSSSSKWKQWCCWANLSIPSKGCVTRHSLSRFGGLGWKLLYFNSI